jgi:hypothetical protein
MGCVAAHGLDGADAPALQESVQRLAEPGQTQLLES